MKWNKYKIKTTTEATDFICGLLVSLGIVGVKNGETTDMRM